MNTLNEKIVLIDKLARLARDASAPRGEAVNAATKLVKIAEKYNVPLTGYKDLMVLASPKKPKPFRSPPPVSKPWEPFRSPPPVSKPWEPVEERPFTAKWFQDNQRSYFTNPYSKPKKAKRQKLLSVMSRGPYKGKTFDEIFQLDPKYLVAFLRANPQWTTLRKSILAYLSNNHPEMSLL